MSFLRPHLRTRARELARFFRGQRRTFTEYDPQGSRLSQIPNKRCKLPKNAVFIESKAQDFAHAKDPNILQNSNYETMVVAVAMF